MKDLLNLIENNPRLTDSEIATMLGKEKGEIAEMIEKCERDGTIVGYKTIIDWDKTDREYVSAFIEIKITPQRDRGFDKIAERIYKYPEVKNLYLMSGGFDLACTIEGKTMKEVAFFVAQKLAPIEDVVSTSTHFVLRKYKDNSLIYGAPETDMRGHDFI